MKNLLNYVVALLFVFMGLSCTAQSGKNESKSTAAVEEKVKVYYFHLTSRCMTCKKVEEEAKVDLKALYGEKIPFLSVDIQDDANKALVNEMKVYGQSLLIVKGDKQINITNEGFMYAKNNPEKFKAIIKEKVDPLIQ